VEDGGVEGAATASPVEGHEKVPGPADLSPGDGDGETLPRIVPPGERRCPPLPPCRRRMVPARLGAGPLEGAGEVGRLRFQML